MKDERNSILKLTVCIIALTTAATLLAAQSTPKSWQRTGPIGAAPKHTTDAYPLSDQANKAGWTKYAPMTDEFDGNGLDSEKWWPKNPRWLGRQPAWFDPANVKVAEGKLNLSMKKSEPPAMPKDKGYHTYTSAAVQSKGLVKYGYFEIKCKPMASAGSSSFWFYNSTPNLWTEIDVFEIGGKAPKFEKKYNMNVHVFRTPTENKHWSKNGIWLAPTNLADAYHTYALEWDAEKIKWYFDGVLIRWVENTHWHQPLTLNFDSETMPDWFGLPKDQDLPSTYSIEYVRTWKKQLPIYVVEPISTKMILPDTSPVPGRISNEISITATPGEYEPASLVIRPNSNIENLSIEAANLESPDAVIPAENIDIKIVKCWYQATSAWTGIHTRPKERRNVLVPELMLNDDTLVKVDRKEQKNYVRLSLPNGPEYVWINDPNEPDGDTMKTLAVEKYPIRDSRSLMPLDIPAHTNKQLWITVKVPQDARPGAYTGNISFRQNAQTIASVTLKLRVLPFKLAEPKTHYDLAQPFVSSIYYRAKLHRDYPKGTISSEQKSEQQLRAELANMFAHGITNPTCYQGFDPELLGRYLQIRNETGMTGMPLYYLGVSANSNPATIKKLKDFVKGYSIDEVYFYGVDEAKGDGLKAQRKAWQATKEAGGKIFVAGGIGRNFEAMGDIQDLHICAGAPSKSEAQKWHSVGHKVFSYANPQGGPEDPQLWRRNFGLALWLQDYDGACTYCYQHSFGNIWNDSDHNHYRDHILAYPTTDGVIDTIALEGYREAIDDIRYATTLMLEIQKARNSADPQKNELADSAEKWLADSDPARKNLDQIREKMIDYILKLKDAREVTQGRAKNSTENRFSQLFTDTRFAQGFLLSYPDVAKGRSVEAILNLGNAENKPKWRLCQWATKYSLANAQPIRNQSGDVTYENEGKRVVVAGPNSPNRDLILEVRGKPEYGQSPRKFGQSWPHLLIEQDAPQIHTLETLHRVRLRIAFRILQCKSNMMQDQYDPTIHAAQFQLFLIVKNVENTSKDFGDYFWFGVPFFDNRRDIPQSFMAKDAGKKDATGKFIYSIDGRKINTTPPINGDWITVQKDLLPHIKAGLKEAVERAYLSDSAIDHYAIVNMNLGWEIPGNFNASVQIKDFKISASPKRN